MIARPWPWSGAAAALLLLVLSLAPVKHGLEATMTTQMLLQLPLLVGVGVLLRELLPERLRQLSAAWDYRGFTGLLLASIAATFWFVPRLLDASVAHSAVDAAKYLSIPLLIGLPLSLSWPRAGFVVRGVFLLEFIATLFRMGWLYLSWPDRLCNSYLLDDQQRLGRYLVLTGVACCLAVGVQLLWGHVDTRPDAPRLAARR
jgi:hypothetical protein